MPGRRIFRLKRHIFVESELTDPLCPRAAWHMIHVVSVFP